uniref:AAA+ ATPase domain-containing protein n=1 Tax=Fagus sylvatica TaxID=28930 RepID=A0A2N9HWD2_FAGSY
MADAFVSVILEQFASIIAREAEQEIRLVVGVDEEVGKLEGNLRTVKAVLNDAEKRQATDEAVKLWLKGLEDICYEMDDVLDEWNTAMIKLKIEKDEEENTENAHVVKKKVCSFIPSPSCCFHQVDKLFLRHDIAHKIKELSGKLDGIVRERERYGFELTSHEVVKRPETTSLVDVSKICGRDKVRNNLLSILLGKKGSEEERNSDVISLVGMGGIGKTTLAQLAYNDHNVETHFEKRMWVCVSEPFDQHRVAKAIIKTIEKDYNDNSTELQVLMEKICELIKKKKLLLVLDDVWTEDSTLWEPFRLALKNSAQGSRILVTTRKIRVAEIMGSTSASMINLEVLSEEDCWLVFSKIAFSGKAPEKCDELEVLGRQIAKKCKGLPLAAKTIGSLMRFKRSRELWQNVLDSNLWELEDVEKVVEKDLFAPDELVEMWMAQGYIDSKENMEIIAREYFENLAIRSFFQDFEKDKDDDTFENCIQLRYLNLLHYNAEGLPKTIYNLCNLQILKISARTYGCFKFLHGIVKLVNLRHLILELNECKLEYPSGFGRLTSLRRLSHFYVSGTKDGCKLGELKDLNQLQGSLDIRGLGNVVDVCEAENAQLKKKIHLHTLKLEFTGVNDRRIENDVSVLNALESPPNLKYLSIVRYRGTTMSPNWTMSLTKLKTLRLDCFKNLEHLPPLGKLPVLESLIVTRLNSLRKVGVEFLGIESENKKEDNMQIFPNLKYLEFGDLEKWEEWIGIGGMREEEENSTITIMPHLQHLTILDCRKLKSLPDFLRTIPLKELEINHSSILHERCQRGTGEEWPKISHIPNIKIGWQYVQRDGQEVKSEFYLWEFEEEEFDIEEDNKEGPFQ